MATKTDDPPIPVPSPTRIAAAETPKSALVSPVLVSAIIIAALYVGREIFIPIVIAVLLSFVLGPLVALLRRWHLPRVVAVGSAVVFTLGIVAALATLIGVQVAGLVGDAPRYRSTIERKIEGLRDSPVAHLTDYVANIGRAIHDAGNTEKAPKPEAEAKPGPETKPARPASEPAPVLVEMRQTPPGPLETASTLLSPVMQPLATTGIVFVVLLFVLMQREDLRDRMIRLAGSSDLHRTTVAMDDAARRLSRYFVVQLALNTAFGLVVGIGLYVIGVPNPVLWGIVSAMMRFVPYIGAFLSALLPLLLAAAVDPGWDMVIATAILFLVLEPLTGQIVEPMLYGHSTGLSPFAVLISALFWTWLWGPVGLLLSTPLTVCLVVLGRHIDKLEFLDVLFGNRAALTPVENFYQRILADDPEEAQEHAELILQTCSLSAYYDDVVLKGLELAARDAARGVLTLEQKTDIRASVSELVDALAERDDRVPAAPAADADDGAEGDAKADPEAAQPSRAAIPPAWSREGAVLCVAGRGFIDTPAAAILAQLLAKRGLGTRIVPFGDVSRAKIADFDPGEAQMTCIVSLAISGEPGHLRRLVDRLRRRMPDVPIVVGLWQADDDAAGRGSIPAAEHVSSLGSAVDTVLAHVHAEPEPSPMPVAAQA
ncbi:AI-2E family transporter [Methylobacterium sp. J-059]|uniref:AI-2E family transporter n=1 Tax=Methylobacterium sp. J-059 TaxID=2836643 RepID=UPI001FB8D9E4|nr:AI-2E family transporter [Methylobacterium sp. J-059]MCJ2039363.1 AI-2E family transporter [Methylobacterium sp. J-059]